ncbi:MAG: hypothetical protein OXI67_16415 [Candidatus Poribacteria bacterium]|nr:hypothetical protein [Candidatus Poribacteria bacterium]
MQDYDVIDAFIEYLRRHGYPELTVTSYPDKENRSTSDIDAIAGPFAIEHTSIDTLPNQRRNDDWFLQVIQGLEEEFHGQLSFRMSITLHYDAVAKGKGQDWLEINKAFKNWIREKSPLLGYGEHKINNIPGIPFQFNIDKRRSHIPGIAFSRFEPQDDTLSCRIKQLFDRKAKKLKRYQNLGKTTILLIENNDKALMNVQGWKILNAIRGVYPFALPDGVDRIWYIDTAKLPNKDIFKDFTSELLTK